MTLGVVLGSVLCLAEQKHGDRQTRLCVSPVCPALVLDHVDPTDHGAGRIWHSVLLETQFALRFSLFCFSRDLISLGFMIFECSVNNSPLQGLCRLHLGTRSAYQSTNSQIRQPSHFLLGCIFQKSCAPTSRFRFIQTNTVSCECVCPDSRTC